MNCGSIFDLAKKKQEVANFEQQTQNPNFWNDRDKAQDILKKINARKYWIDEWDKLSRQMDDIDILIELAEEEDDPEIESEIEKNLDKLNSELEELEFKNMLGEPDDRKSAIFTIHPGAGGTESQDWAQMLMRMYLRWIERNGFNKQILDFQHGDEAGIKSVTIEVTGDYAYGYLKAEAGIHRLVRLSPFDFNNRRHTSFASVFVYPEVDDDIEININQADIRVDTYRASGAGGQHVNKTSSAVRITHIPTGIVVQCQSERSQHMNRESAMKVLMSRLYQLKKEEELAKLDKIEKDKKEIGWGHQIRSYIFHPYNLVKDHRTGNETSNTSAVMDGELNDFIKAYLMGKVDSKHKRSQTDRRAHA
ncbi:peptide chain release factor 2 [candidate division KSB1 bacterium]|nr:peptide chain release factor 2 [candidate division KSB1 bacterium]